ncbi:MAG: heavy-metal-associated domain-containing protein [Thermomicrobiales bacterium]
MANGKTQITLDVPGINCGHCESTIREEVGALPGVSRVEPSNQTKTVVIDFEPAHVSLDTIRSTLAEAGYPAQN